MIDKDKLWELVVSSASSGGGTFIAKEEPPEEYCNACENGGWVYSSFQASGGPNFEECPDCYNPNDLPCP